MDWYDSEAKVKKMTVLSTNANLKKVASKNVSAAVDFSNYQVKVDGKAVMELELNYQGRDEVYNSAYPYEVTYKKNSTGACQSDKIKRKNIQENSSEIIRLDQPRAGRDNSFLKL